MSRRKNVLLIGIIILIIILIVILSSCEKKIEVNYSLESDSEKYTISIEYNKKIKDGYYINIIHNDKVYNYQWKSKYFGEKVIYNIKLYKDDEKECILPLFDGRGAIFDLKCNYGDYVMFYHDMPKNKNINAFLENISGYDSDNYVDYGNPVEYNQFQVYLNNLPNEINFESYKGLIFAEKSVEEIELFKNDVYTKELGVFTFGFYMIPNYDEKYEFNTIYVVDLYNHTKKEIKLEKPISFTSYIQGVYYDLVYLFDMENKIQYMIDLYNLSVEVIGNLEDDINVYEDNEWKKESVSKIMKEKPTFEFNDYRKKIDNNTYVDEIDDNIYTFKKEGNYYKIFVSSKYMPNIKTYLFNIDDIDSVKYFDDYLFFKEDNCLYLYSIFTGKRKIIQSNELLFNKAIDYHF